MRVLLHFAFISIMFAVTGEQNVMAMERQLDGSEPENAEELAWLEDRRGKQALEWVAEQNAKTSMALTNDPRYQEFFDIALESLNDSERMISTNAVLYRGRIHDVLMDSDHPRGLWRVAPISSFHSGSPAWESVLSVSELSRKERKNYWLAPGLRWNGSRVMVVLAEGAGVGSVEYREFDLDRREFVQNGFRIEPGKGATLTWWDDETLLVADAAGGRPASRDGWPLAVSLLRRGEHAASRTDVFRADRDTTAGVGVIALLDIDEEVARRACILR